MTEYIMREKFHSIRFNVTTSEKLNILFKAENCFDCKKKQLKKTSKFPSRNCGIISFKMLYLMYFVQSNSLVSAIKIHATKSYYNTCNSYFNNPNTSIIVWRVIIVIIVGIYILYTDE
jgi:hypothetical protein